MRERTDLTSRGAVLVAGGRDGRTLGANYTGRQIAAGLSGLCAAVPWRWRPLYVRAYERAARNNAGIVQVPGDWRPTLGEAAPLARYGER